MIEVDHSCVARHTDAEASEQVPVSVDLSATWLSATPTRNRS